MKYLKNFVVIIATFFIVIILISIGSVMSKFEPGSGRIDKDSILTMELNGVILDSKRFVSNLHKYSKKDKIKGILIRINSPGGAVGPSQEIYSEIKRVRDEIKKPIVVSCASVAASGAYYAAVGADQIIANPGSMLGSIGVIMEFANLENLYQWAKVQRYVIKSGPYKDAGSEFRKMTPEEKELFQNMINEVFAQFKQAVSKGRKLSMDVVDKYADGRVFTGQTAVKLGFADQLGSYRDALRVIGELSGLGADPKTFSPPKKRPDVFDFLAESKFGKKDIEGAIENILHTKYSGIPMYLMPGALGNSYK